MASKKEKLGLIILAGGHLEYKLPFLVDASSNAALIPVGLKTAIRYLFEFYINSVSDIVLICK